MSRHLISTRATHHTCPVCKISTLVAHADGVPVRVDVTPINPVEEVAALAEGRSTYTMIRCGELVHRDEHKIKAGLLRGTIHRQHRCPRERDRWARKLDRTDMVNRRRAGKATQHAARLRRVAAENFANPVSTTEE